MGQIFRLTSFLNNLLNFLRVIFENMIGTTDKYNILDVYLIYLKLWFFGEDQKCSWGSKMKNKPNFFW